MRYLIGSLLALSLWANGFQAFYIAYLRTYPPEAPKTLEAFFEETKRCNAKIYEALKAQREVNQQPVVPPVVVQPPTSREQDRFYAEATWQLRRQQIEQMHERSLENLAHVDALRRESAR